MKHAIACLNTQIGILLHNASVFHGEGREEDRDRNIAEADDMRMAVEALRDEIPLSERMGLNPADPWEEIANQFSRDADFYRSIVTRIGELYGDAAKRCDDGTMSQDVLALVVPELVETSVKQFRLLASFVGSKATSHTEIVSDTAAEIRALRTSLEAERQRRIDAEWKLEKFRMDYGAKAAEVVELRGREPKYRMLEAGETIEEGDLFRNTDNEWAPTQSIGRKVSVCGEYLRPVNPVEETPKNGHEEPKYRMLEEGEWTQNGDEFLYEGMWTAQAVAVRVVEQNVGSIRRPISLDTKPENPETPAA